MLFFEKMSHLIKIVIEPQTEEKFKVTFHYDNDPDWVIEVSSIYELIRELEIGAFQQRPRNEITNHPPV